MGSQSFSSEESVQNWIPVEYQKSAESLAKETVVRFVKADHVIGLGSGPMAAAIIRAMGDFDRKNSLECIPSSFQIKMEAEHSGLRLADESRIPEIDVVFDGADEVDRDFNMIKGGGGALLREKILHSAARHVVTAAEDKKFLASFTWPVPVEVHPFAYHIVRKKLHDDFGGLPNTRMLKESYPYVTENGNFIFDTKFDFRARVSDIRGYETKLKNIPGVVEVGLFTKRSGTYYKAKFDGSFERLEVP